MVFSVTRSAPSVAFSRRTAPMQYMDVFSVSVLQRWVEKSVNLFRLMRCVCGLSNVVRFRSEAFLRVGLGCVEDRNLRLLEGISKDLGKWIDEVASWLDEFHRYSSRM